MIETPSYQNQVGIFNPDSFAFPVNIIGVGKRPGWMVLFALASMGVKSFHLWDSDTLKDENLPGSIFLSSDKGRACVDAVADFVKRQELTCEIVCHTERVTADTPLNGVVISCADKSVERKEIFAAVRKNIASVPLFMDGQVQGDVLRLFTFQPTDRAARKEYEASILDANETTDQSIVAAFMLSSIVAGQLKNWHKALPFEGFLRFDMREMRLKAEIDPNDPTASEEAAVFEPNLFTDPIHIVGVGSIGSTLLFLLLLMGAKDVHLWDADTLERHNTPTQPIYRTTSDCGELKVKAAEAFAERQELLSSKLTLHPEFVDENTPLSGVVISGVDSMKARSEIYTAIKSHAADIPLYMDGRIGGEIMELLTFLPTDDAFRKYYEAHMMVDDKDVPELPCGGRNIIGPPLALAAVIAENLVLWSRSKPFERHVRFAMRKSRFDIFRI